MYKYVYVYIYIYTPPSCLGVRFSVSFEDNTGQGEYIEGVPGDPAQVSRTLLAAVVESVLMASRPPTICYTLCYILQTIFCIHGLFKYYSKTTPRRQL